MPPNASLQAPLIHPCQTRHVLKEKEAFLNANTFETEASGGVNLSNIRAIAKTGVDYISVGALTHSVTGLDISLEIEES